MTIHTPGRACRVQPKRRCEARLAGIVAVVLILCAAGCGGGESATTVPPTTAAPETATGAQVTSGERVTVGEQVTPSVKAVTDETPFPDGITRIVGQSGPIWVAIPGSLFSVEWAPGSAAGWPGCSVGAKGERVVLWSLETGQVFLWEPVTSGAITELNVGAAYEISDVWMSPLETRLIVICYEPSTDQTSSTPHVYLLDLVSSGSKELSRLEEAVSSGATITCHAWSADDSAVFFSVGELGGDQGSASFRYDIEQDRMTKLEGLAQVWAVGPEGEVLGCSTAEPTAAPGAPWGIDDQQQPCVVWREGRLEPLPHDDKVGAWSRGIFSADGSRVAVDCRWWEEGQTLCGIEIFTRESEGWKLTSLTRLPGASSMRARSFTADGAYLWLEKGVGEFSSGQSWLCRLNIETGEAVDEMLLPFAGWGKVRALVQKCTSG